MTKGAVAIGAGVALLLGGAGTYALWSDTEAVDGTVASGDLDLTLGTAAWTLNGTPVAAGTEGTVRIVPGDVLQLTQPVTVTAIGDDLESTLTITEGLASIDGDTLLDENLTVDLALDTATATWATADAVTPNAYDVAPADAAYAPVDATVTITFEDVVGQVATASTVDLNAVEFTLTQN